MRSCSQGDISNFEPCHNLCCLHCCLHAVVSGFRADTVFQRMSSIDLLLLFPEGYDDWRGLCSPRTTRSRADRHEFPLSGWGGCRDGGPVKYILFGTVLPTTSTRIYLRMVHRDLHLLLTMANQPPAAETLSERKPKRNHIQSETESETETTTKSASASMSVTKSESESPQPCPNPRRSRVRVRIQVRVRAQGLTRPNKTQLTTSNAQSRHEDRFRKTNRTGNEKSLRTLLPNRTNQ